MYVRGGPVFLVVLLPLVVACDSRQDQAMAPPARAAATSLVWQPLGTWSGRGGRQTESFDITTGSLRLTWEALAEDAPGTGRFRVALHSAISGRPLQTIVDTIGAGTDTARIGGEPARCVPGDRVRSDRLARHAGGRSARRFSEPGTEAINAALAEQRLTASRSP